MGIEDNQQQRHVYDEHIEIFRCFVAPIVHSHRILIISSFRLEKWTLNSKAPGLKTTSLISHLLIAELTSSDTRALAATSPFVGRSHVQISTLTMVWGFAEDPRAFLGNGTRRVARKLLVECYNVSTRHWFVAPAPLCWSPRRHSSVKVKRLMKAFRYSSRKYYCYYFHYFHFD